jgi:hypothetical protein
MTRTVGGLKWTFPEYPTRQQLKEPLIYERCRILMNLEQLKEPQGRLPDRLKRVIEKSLEQASEDLVIWIWDLNCWNEG